ncbi:MAG: hypothetical protein NXI31_16950 [bacterium]|nr:hypothetical protein [bacterium]
MKQPGRHPKKHSRAGIWVGIASLLGVLMLAFVNLDREPPGPVSAVHGAIASIEGGSNCAACHGGWFGDMQKACSECHEDVATQISDGAGLHGRLAPGVANNCSTCHGEHHGTDFRLVNRLAFAQAGVADPDAFDHTLVGFEMAGAHVELGCQDCHVNAEAEVLAEGQKRFLGLSQRCDTCHADPHGGRMQLACTSCHTQDTFQTRFVPNHDNWLALDGPHGNATCRDCHSADSPRALERMSPLDRRSNRQCGDCHDSPHSEQFVAGNATAQNVTVNASCESCHPLDLLHFADPNVTVDATQHAHSGFPLAAQHAGVTCNKCHSPPPNGSADYATRHPGRTPTDCRSCHEDPHAGQFDVGPFAAKGCVSCHADTHFTPHEFDRDKHALSRFPLTGAHDDLDCDSCHRDPESGNARQFHDTPHRCEQCHGDAHRGAFAAHDAELQANPQGTCAECHGTDSFRNLDLSAFHHGERTGFAIDGAHDQIECTDCHTRQPRADEYGRTFGRILGDSAAFAGCASCHPDPHQGQFDGAGVPATIDGRNGCARCHDTVSFRTLPHGFAHAEFTGFALTGRHAELDCVACHALRDVPDKHGRETMPAKGRECGDCHSDPHQGQFERFGRTNCGKCHKSQTSFRRLSFRHNLDSRFQLGDAHRKVPCASCHKPELFGTATSVRYKPLPTNCVECHGTDRPRRKGR